MRYREAYELIDAAVGKAELGFPVTETLKAMFFDQEVETGKFYSWWERICLDRQ